MDRRDFLKNSGVMAAAAALAPSLSSCSGNSSDISASLTAGKGVPEAYDCDLLVVGGGPAGTCAAIAAARMGVEPSSWTAETAWEVWRQKGLWVLS